MSISAEKDRNGNATGWWIVDVTRDFKRIKKRTDNIEHARDIERELKGGVSRGAPARPKASPPAGMTLGQLEAKAHQIWAYKRDRQNSTRQLQAVVKALGPDTPLTDITYSKLSAFADQMLVTPLPRRKGTYDPKTVNRYLSAISAALRWAHKHDFLAAMPRVPQLEESEGRIAHLRADDDERFLAWLRANREPRMAMCAEILLATGMRISELLGLTESNLEPGWIKLTAQQAKSKSPRDIPVPAALEPHLSHMVSFGFPHQAALRSAMVRATKILGLTDKVTPHVLRHTVATRLTARGVPTATVMRFLGHKNINTTLKYAHVQQEDLRAAQGLLVQP